MDVTYWGRNFGVVIMKDSLSGDVLWFKFINTRVRDNFSMKRVPTALIFPHIQAVPPAYSQKNNMQ